MATDKRQRQKERRAVRRVEDARRRTWLRRRALFRTWLLLSGFSLAAIALITLLSN